MRNTCWVRILATLAFMLLAAHAAAASGPLVSAQWLRDNRDAVLVIDASSSRQHAAKHIPGAVGVDLYTYGSPHAVAPPEMERRIQSWGLSPGVKVVVYDAGASMEATWLFYELYYHGYPEADLAILDGGLAAWEASGGEVTKAATPTPARGTFRVTAVRDEARVRLAEFVNASGDPSRHVLVDALEPATHYGGTKFFDRAGHVPNAISLPVSELFNADKTFKSGGSVRTMAGHLGIRPDQQVHSHCGGGIAATVPWFALRFLAGYPSVRVYKESQLEWLRDERGLPFWTYAAPYLKRDATWLAGWGSRMMRMYDAAQLSVIDIRPREAYARDHVPYAVNLPADELRRDAADPAKLQARLGPAGIDPSHEAVIVSTGGVNPSAALAFAALEKAGQRKVSLLMDSIDDWGLRGLPLAKEPTAVRAKRSPMEVAVSPVAYTVPARSGVIVDNTTVSAGPYPRVYVASGERAPAEAPDGTVVHLHYKALLAADGTPKPAHEIRAILAEANVPRYAELVAFAEDPGEAAVTYFVLRLMGYPDVKLMLPRSA